MAEEERLESKRASHRRWKARNRESVRAYARKRYRENPAVRARSIKQALEWAKANPERHIKSARISRKLRRDTDPSYREKINREVREFRINNPEKIRAQNALNSRVRSGKIIRPKVCSVCGGSGRIEAHHYKGYVWEYRLDIQWVCTRCHKRIQKKKKRSTEQRITPETNKLDS